MLYTFHRKIYGYECDIYGHLNNSNYLQILEAARSDALTEMDMPISRLNSMGIQIFVLRYELDFIKAVELEDIIEVRSAEREISRLRARWTQDVYNSRGELCLSAVMHCCFARRGKANRISTELYQHFLKFLLP
ncbi:MAG: acyl-CoA thioesterase [Candidatus Cloacimonetes bacterium]|nr:acyl-CoA thioesterase [Candidatus Cloacimonadota bacterium]